MTYPVERTHRGDFAHAFPGTPTETYAWRAFLLRLLGDLKRKPVFDLAEPVGSVRDSPRPCSTCRGLTTFTTARGRSVHPTCEGYTDTMTEDAVSDLVWAIAQVIPLKGVEVTTCPYDPVFTLGAADTTGKPRLPPMGSAPAASAPSSAT